MSNLRDRLKKIAAERKDAPQAAPAPRADSAPRVDPAPRAVCAQIVREAEIPPLRLSANALALMGGEAFAGLRLAPEDLLFLDTETTGLSGGVGTIAFEVGVGEVLGEKMRITQLYLRDYDEEEDLLRRLLPLFAGKRAVVTFNGKSFDLPLLTSRCTLYRLRAPWQEMAHLDLVHPARRLYKLRLRSCTLGDLEEKILGAPRAGDIPGREVPALWAQFLRTRDEGPLQRVFEHNFQDVRAMALLLQALARAHDEPEGQMHFEDLYSVGRIYDRAGRADVAERCYAHVVTGSCRVRAGQALHRLYRRQGRAQDALRLLEEMAASGAGGTFPYVEMAKLYEHRLHDPARALRCTDLALALSRDAAEQAELLHRRARLARRLDGSAVSKRTKSTRERV